MVNKHSVAGDFRSVCFRAQPGKLAVKLKYRLQDGHIFKFTSRTALRMNEVFMLSVFTQLELTENFSGQRLELQLTETGCLPFKKPSR